MNQYGYARDCGLGLAGLVLATHLKDPHLLPVRSYETPVLLAIALLGLMVALWRLRKHVWRYAPLMAVWLTIVGLVGFDEYEVRAQKQAVLTATANDVARLVRLGEHIVVGYNEVADVRELAQRGFIAGLFVTRRNAEGKTLEQLGAEIAGLQMLRRQAGLPPLMIASDQEGGSVSRLSPPLPRQPGLASLLVPGLTNAEIERHAAAYGVEQGKALAALGVNTNFSPVVDLIPDQTTSALDFHTRIATRAIARDPDVVANVALAYSRALLGQGVLPTLKHFPGLGSVAGDTHHFSARLSLPLDELSAHDWYPFRQVLGQTSALLMVGHVIVDALDPELPASLSEKVLSGVVRNKWHHDGALVSDDMTMAAVYNRGLCRSSIRSLNAGMDLLLLSYDWEKVYPVLDCLMKADKAGELKDLASSRQRLGRLPWR